MGYTRSAIAGFSWQTLLKIGSALIVVVKLAILARLLNPEQLGVFSLVMISLGLTESFTQTGVNVTLLQSSKPVSFFINSAWVIAIIRGLLIGVLMTLVGYGMSFVFDAQNLLLFVSLAALIPIIKGWINPAIVSMQKNLHFSADTAFRFSLVIVDTIVSVVCVWWLRSISGLILGMLVSAVFEVCISFIFFKDRPKLRFRREEALPIIKNARGLGLSSLLSYLNENMDNLLIGRLLGTYELGLYQPTYGLAHVPNYEVSKSAHHGTFPIYTKVVDDQKRLRRAFFRAGATTLGLGLLASLPLLLFPDQFMALIFGAKWSGAIELLPWLVVAGLLQAVIMVFYSLFYATNSLRVMNLHALLSFVGLVVGIWYFVGIFGLLGTGMALVVSRLLGLPLLLFGAVRSLNS